VWTSVLKSGTYSSVLVTEVEEQMRETTGIILTVRWMHPNGVVSPYEWVSIWAATGVQLQMALNAQHSPLKAGGAQALKHAHPSLCS